MAMAITTGKVSVVVETKHTGDAAVQVEKVSRAVDKLAKAGDSTTKKMLGLKGALAQVGGIASSTLGSMVSGMGAAGELVVGVTEKFGALGWAVAGVVGVVGGLVGIFAQVESQRFDGVAKSLGVAASQAGALARAMQASVTASRELNVLAKQAELRELSAKMATALASGDKVGAASFQARIGAITGGNESGALRDQAAGAFKASAVAAVDRLAILAELAKQDKVVADLQAQLDSGLSFAARQAKFGWTSETQVLEAALNGQIAMRELNRVTLGAMDPGIPGSNSRAGASLLKAADAIDKEVLTEGAKTVLDAAVGALTDAARQGSGGLSGGSGGGLQDDGDALMREWQMKMGALPAPDRSAAAVRAEERRFMRRLERWGGGEDGAGPAKTAADIRDFSSALTDALPGMDAFTGALERVSDIWTKWGEGSASTKDAVVGSLGAIAQAGAAQIKNSRLRAGVLSITELGLGFANIENPPVAAAHFTASAILGGVAIFGGSSAGSGKGSGTSQRAARLQSTGEMLGGRAVGVTINGNYYAFGRGDQEAARDLQRLGRRVDGTGFEQRAS